MYLQKLKWKTIFTKTLVFQVWAHSKDITLMGWAFTDMGLQRPLEKKVHTKSSYRGLVIMDQQDSWHRLN